MNKSSTQSKSKSKSKKIPKPVDDRDSLDVIRDEYPDDPMGDQWEGVGCYIGEGVWGDPDYFGMPSQRDIFGW